MSLRITPIGYMTRCPVRHRHGRVEQMCTGLSRASVCDEIVAESSNGWHIPPTSSCRDITTTSLLCSKQPALCAQPIYPLNQSGIHQSVSNGFVSTETQTTTSCSHPTANAPQRSKLLCWLTPGNGKHSRYSGASRQQTARNNMPMWQRSTVTKSSPTALSK